MKQPEDTRTADWVGGETGNRLSLAGLLAQRDKLADKIKRSKPRGAYAGAVKIGADNQAQRARTKLSQAEFAKLAGVSERTLRTWERGDEVSYRSKVAILSALANIGQARKPARPVRYYDSHTGQSWTGRGLMPRWLRAEMDKGRRLADFERAA